MQRRKGCLSTLLKCEAFSTFLDQNPLFALRSERRSKATCYLMRISQSCANRTARTITSGSVKWNPSITFVMPSSNLQKRRAVSREARPALADYERCTTATVPPRQTVNHFFRGGTCTVLFVYLWIIGAFAGSSGAQRR